MKENTQKEFLMKQIQLKEKEFEKNKFRRTVFMILVITLVLYSIIFSFRNEIKDIKSFILAIIICVFGAIFYFYINLLIFIPLISKSIEEGKQLDDLIQKYRNLNK